MDKVEIVAYRGSERLVFSQKRLLWLILDKLSCLRLFANKRTGKRSELRTKIRRLKCFVSL